MLVSPYKDVTQYTKIQIKPHMMNSDIQTPVNIGNPEEFTILGLATKIKTLIDPDLKFIFKPKKVFASSALSKEKYNLSQEEWKKKT